MANRIDIKHTMPTDRELSKMFDAVPQLRRHDVMNATLRSGSKVVVDRAKKEAPRSKERDVARRSVDQRTKYNWDSPPLWKTIARVIRKSSHSGLAVIGPKFPDGNKAYFNQPRSGKRRHVLWGVDTGRVYVVTRNWLAFAFDQTRSQQLSAMKSTLKKKIDEMWMHV